VVVVGEDFVSYSYRFLIETTLLCASVFIVVTHGKKSLCCTAEFRRIRHFIFKHHFPYLSLWVCNSINGLDYHGDSTPHSTKPLRCTYAGGAVNELHALCGPWCWTDVIVWVPLSPWEGFHYLLLSDLVGGSTL
jgi:hypothetical protein